MRVILKILAAPLVAVLAIIIWIFAFLLSLSSVVLASPDVTRICGVIAIFTISVTNGIIVLAIAFLVIPFVYLCWRRGCWANYSGCGMPFRTEFMDENSWSYGKM
jgi:hypothetical protein